MEQISDTPSPRLRVNQLPPNGYSSAGDRPAALGWRSPERFRSRFKAVVAIINRTRGPHPDQPKRR
jgi:hypothetical protein